MIHSINRCSRQTLAALLLAGCFLVLAAPDVAARDGAEDKTGGGRASTRADGGTAEPAPADAKPVNLHYTPLNSSITFEPAATFGRTIARAEVEAKPVVKVDLNKAVAGAAPRTGDSVPMPQSRTREPLKFIPMTVGEKFMLWFNGAILSPGAYGQAAFAGIRGEAFDKDHDPNGDHGHFLADAGTRAARSFAFATTSKFFHRFVYASIFRQDPRYHPSYKKAAGARIKHAVSRVFITSGDKGGSQFNISFLGGGITAGYIAKTWERDERKTTKRIFSRWGNNIALTALTNIVREFLTGQ